MVRLQNVTQQEKQEETGSHCTALRRLTDGRTVAVVVKEAEIVRFAMKLKLASAVASGHKTH